MSSSSLCSTTDICIDSDNDYFPLHEALVLDIKRFANYADRLRRSLDSSTAIPDGESMCVSVHSALSLVSQSVRDLLFKYPIFKTSQVLLPAGQLVQSVKEINFDNSNIDALLVLACLQKLESAVENTLKQSLSHPGSLPTKFSTATLGRKTKSVSNGVRNGTTLIRRYSAYQPKGRETELDVNEMDRMVANRPDGIDIAFDRGKAWSKYCKELLNYVSRRMQLELEHAKRVQNLARQTKLILNEFQNFLPLKDVFDSSFETDVAFCEQTDDAVKHAQDRFIKALEMRRDDHDRQRRLLKNEWIRMNKQVKDTQQELVRARSLFSARVDGYRRAQENFENTKATGPAVGSEVMRRKKELERRRKNEEEAHNKRIEAESQVEKLERELERRQHDMQDTKVRIVGQLRELVYRCDQTTKACSTHYFQALANLWVGQPGKYHEFADATRSYSPGSEYISFLQSHLPRRTVSSSSLYRGENEEDLSSTNHTGPSSSSSSQRRNAIDVNDSETLPERKQKKTILRLIDNSAIEATSEAAKTHHFQKVRQPTRCAHCDAFSIFSTVQCTQCRMMWHKSCVPRITITCDQSLGTSVDSRRRMSIFGVSLQTYLDGVNRQYPLILECCIDELQKHGLRVRGIYRTCGVKSKVEQICEEFEKASCQKDVNLSCYHPMNIASVVKLYLRQLPQPLLTQELYSDWVSFAKDNLTEVKPFAVEKIKLLLKKLPLYNYSTLKFLILHLNRVTWFEMDNLMSASNLGAVISPSLIWKHPSAPFSSDSSFFNDAHLMSKAVELLIKMAFEIFDLDRSEDWKEFFQKYPEVDEPQMVDPEIEAHIIEGEMDDLLDDEDTEPVGLMFQPQPPTPDLLKNTLRSKKESFSASDDIDLDSSLGSAGEANGPGGGCPQQFSFAAPVQLQDQSNSRKPKAEKKRSYTTSILVSPRCDRKPQNYGSTDDPKVTNPDVDKVRFNLSEGQLSITNEKDSGHSFKQYDMSMGVQRNFGIGYYGSERNFNLKQDVKDENRVDVSNSKMCLSSAGVLFTGSDVSYI